MRRPWSRPSVPSGLLAIALAATPACHPAGPREAALVQAIKDKNPQAAQQAIAAGVDFRSDVKDQSGRLLPLPFFLVRETASTPGPPDPRLEQIAVAAFAAGADPNARYRGQRLIAEAVRGRSVVVVDAMIKAGLDVKGYATGLALLAACRDDHAGIVERLVAAGADVNFQDLSATATTPLETPLAAAVRVHDAAMIAVLERAGAREWIVK
jgi:hypothetical protein